MQAPHPHAHQHIARPCMVQSCRVVECFFVHAFVRMCSLGACARSHWWPKFAGGHSLRCSSRHAGANGSVSGRASPCAGPHTVRSVPACDSLLFTLLCRGIGRHMLLVYRPCALLEASVVVSPWHVFRANPRAAILRSAVSRVMILAQSLWVSLPAHGHSPTMCK